MYNVTHKESTRSSNDVIHCSCLRCEMRTAEHQQRVSHLYSSVAGAHDTSTSGMHLGQVVEGQDVAGL